MPIQETKTKGKGKRNKRAAPESDNSALKDFKVEYSKSSRATCPECEIKICKVSWFSAKRFNLTSVKIK